MGNILYIVVDMNNIKNDILRYNKPRHFSMAFVYKIYVYEKKEKWSRPEGNDIDIVFTVGFREQHTVRTSDAIAS